MIITSTGREITRETAAVLAKLYGIGRGEHLAGRLWNEVLTGSERIALGGDFKAAFLFDDRRGIGMFHRARPGLTFERALLEAMREVGGLRQPQSERLVKDIGESIELPTAKAREQPKWLPKQGELRWRNRAVRRIRQPGKAVNIVAILGGFENSGWPSHLPIGVLGRIDGWQIRQAVHDLNKGLQALHFRMDGQGAGVVWEVLKARQRKKPGANRAVKASTKTPPRRARTRSARA